MKLFSTILISSLLLCTVFIPDSPAHAAPLPPTYREGTMNFSLYSEYFWTNSNYNRYGDTMTLPTGNTFANFTTTLDAAFDFEGNFSLGGGLNFGMSNAHTENVFNVNQEVNYSNSQVTNAHFFARYFIDWDRFRLVPELKGSVTFETININDSSNTSPLTQDYTNTATAGSWGIMNFGSLRGWGYLGFTYQDDSRANLMPWEAGLLWRNHNFLVAGSFDGYKTVVNDNYTWDYFYRENRVAYADGGSYKFYSTNPSLTEVRGTVGFAFENNIIVTGGYVQTISGNETAIGQMVFAGVSFGVDMVGGPGSMWESRKKHRPVQRENIENPSAMPKPMDATPGQNGGFQPDLEQYDESLFD